MATRQLASRAFAAALAMLSGCATPNCGTARYVPQGPHGGFRQLDYGPDVLEIRYQWSSVPVLPKPVAPDFALLRAAEIARSRGAALFCIEGLQKWNGQPEIAAWPESLEYAAVTIQIFETPRTDREIAPAEDAPARLHACFEPSEIERRLRAEHGIPNGAPLPKSEGHEQ